MAQHCFTILSIRSILSVIWSFICRCWGDEDDYYRKDSAQSTSDVHLALEANPERKQLLPAPPGRDDRPPQQDADMPQCQAPAVNSGGREGSTQTTEATEATAADLRFDSGPIDHFTDGSVGLPIDDCGERKDALRREEADRFWKLRPEKQSWYHKDEVTGEEIWAPLELD